MTATRATDAFSLPLLLGDALNGAPVAAMLKSTGGNYVAVNDAACALTGYPREELMTLTAEQLSGRSTDEVEEILAGFRRGEGLPGRGPLRRRDGTVVEVEYEQLPTKVGGVDFVLFLVRPVRDT